MPTGCDAPAGSPSPPVRPAHRIFFALFPDGETRRGVVELRAALQSRLVLPARGAAAERLHVTLVHVGDFVERPEAVIERAAQAAAGLAEGPIHLRFDRVSSFRGRPGHRPCILLGDEAAMAAVVAFQRRLQDALRAQGLDPKGHAVFTPHLTLLYADTPVAEQPAGPIEWTARGFALIDSLIGQGRYETLGSWPLEPDAG